jgi:hypothetical protein
MCTKLSALGEGTQWVFFLIFWGEFSRYGDKEKPVRIVKGGFLGEKVTCRHRQWVLLIVMRTRQKSRKYLFYRLASRLAKWFIPLLDDHESTYLTKLKEKQLKFQLDLHKQNCTHQSFFFNWRNSKLKDWEWSDFGGLQLPKVRGKTVKIAKFVYLVLIV